MWRLGVIVAMSCGRAHFDPIPVSGDASDASTLPSPVVWFNFETAPGAVIPDIASGHPGSCTTCPVPVPGHRGQGYMFNGVNACILVPDVGQLGYPAFTLSVWTNQAISNKNMSIVEKLVGLATDMRNSYQIETGDSGQPLDGVSFTTYSGGTGNTYMWSSAGVLVIGTWQHLAITWDGSTKRLYLGGAPMAEATAAPLAYDSGPMRIGCDDNGFIDQPYNGAIDELQIYDRAFTDLEIQTLATM
jgi:hypothetical protein